MVMQEVVTPASTAVPVLQSTKFQSSPAPGPWQKRVFVGSASAVSMRRMATSDVAGCDGRLRPRCGFTRFAMDCNVVAQSASHTEASNVSTPLPRRSFAKVLKRPPRLLPPQVEGMKRFGSAGLLHVEHPGG